MRDFLELCASLLEELGYGIYFIMWRARSNHPIHADTGKRGARLREQVIGTG